MNVISHNPDRTIGVVSDATELQHVGGFSLELMVEWLKTINATFDADRKTTIHLFSKKSDKDHSHALFASADGKDPMVVIAGRAPADDEPWGDVRL